MSGADFWVPYFRVKESPGPGQACTGTVTSFLGWRRQEKKKELEPYLQWSCLGV